MGFSSSFLALFFSITFLQQPSLPHMWAYLPKGISWECFGSHFLYSSPPGQLTSQHPVSHGGGGGSPRAAKDPILSSPKGHFRKKTRPHQRKAQSKHPQIKAASPKVFLLEQELCLKLQKNSPRFPRQRDGNCQEVPFLFLFLQRAQGQGLWLWQQPGPY